MALYHSTSSVLVFLLFIFIELHGTRAQLPSPPLSAPDAAGVGVGVGVGEPAFVFDGLDYDALPDHIRREYRDCYHEQYRCIRFRNHIGPVCGYNENTKGWDAYVSLCQLDHQNCIEMVGAERGMHGNALKDRIIYYMGDGKRCEFEMRRFHERIQTSPLPAPRSPLHAPRSPLLAPRFPRLTAASCG